MTLWSQPYENGVKFRCQVKANAKQSALVAITEDGALKIRIGAIPQKGEANTALIHFLSQVLDCRKTDIILEHGHSSSIKTLIVKHITLSDLTKRIYHGLS